MSAGFYGKPSAGHIGGLVQQKAQRGCSGSSRDTHERPPFSAPPAPRAFQEQLSIRLSHQVMVLSADQA
jgi:hypothetical protein